MMIAPSLQRMVRRERLKPPPNCDPWIWEHQRHRVKRSWIRDGALWTPTYRLTNTLGTGPTAATGNDANPTVVLAATTATHGVGIAIGWNSNATLNSCTISGESNATIVTSSYYNATMVSKLQFAYLPTLSGSGSKTITATLSAGTFWSMYAWTLAGADTSTFFDSENGATGNTTNPSFSLTTLSANCSIFVLCSTQGSKPAVGSGFSYALITVPDFNVFENGEYILDAGAAGAKTVDMVADLGQWVSAAAAFKTAGGAPPEPGPTLQTVQSGLRW